MARSGDLFRAAQDDPDAVAAARPENDHEADASQAVKTKIDLFDIRSSVLDFIEPISNFSIQLKKHFRSYPEMIGFSSKYFYGDSLQVMKIRGKPIEDVVEFDKI